MSRLTKEQAIKHYGLNLPTPIIEKITLSSVKDSDEIYESMDTRTAVDAYAAAHEEMNIEDAHASAVDYNKLVRVTVNLSFRFTTWEGFDVSDITKELFQTFMADGESNEGQDELYEAALKIVQTEKKASTSFLQRNFQIGYNKAARVMEALEQRGVVSQPNHSGKREILINN